ncbi:DUF4304 domain-containing protein [Leucothrix arctica]|uniref:DUF4304 domain-containing protein n=1 Tax=Leucothrix arctica TaxID=1481894 RepID=UPI0013048F5F|nr:DUF4304 domain-containing protein [Leucothrix arctica]
MTKDYKSFSSVSKSRFRKMAKELGYEQLSGINYIKQRDGWFEGFSLQASSYGNDFFYINYGISVPNLWEPFDEEINLKNLGYSLSHRLHHNSGQGFPNGTKVQIEESVDLAIEKYMEQASPWFNKINGLTDITEMYFNSTDLEENKLGEHDSFLCLKAANYGLFLFKSGDLENSLVWLKEAGRLYSEEEYLEDYEIDQKNTINNVIKVIKSA